jgi:hypothetical protein
MKKRTRRSRIQDPDRDTLRAEYDFSSGVRGVTAARYAKGTNVAVLDPDVKRLFPTSAAVNDALRALAAIAQRATRTRRPTA